MMEQLNLPLPATSNKQQAEDCNSNLTTDHVQEDKTTSRRSFQGNADTGPSFQAQIPNVPNFGHHQAMSHHPTPLSYPALQLFYLLPTPHGPTLVPVQSFSSQPQPVFLPSVASPLPVFPPDMNLSPRPPPGFEPFHHQELGGDGRRELFRPWEQSENEKEAEKTLNSQT